MKPSRILIEHIKQSEGLQLKAYKPVPTEKYFTIGYGHHTAVIKPNERITPQQAQQLLIKDLTTVSNYINTIKEVRTQGQHDALCSFIYNIGTNKFQTSTLYKLIKAKASTKLIQNEFNKWIYAGGKPLKGLITRRKWEATRYIE